MVRFEQRLALAHRVHVRLRYVYVASCLRTVRSRFPSVWELFYTAHWKQASSVQDLSQQTIYLDSFKMWHVQTVSMAESHYREEEVMCIFDFGLNCPFNVSTCNIVITNSLFWIMM